MNTAADRHYARIPGYEHYAKDPLQVLFDKWLHKRRFTVKASTFATYKTLMSDVIGFAKGRLIVTMDQQWAESLLHYLLHQKQLNPNVVRNKLKYLRFVLTYGVDEGMFEKMPFSFKKLPRVQKARVDKRPFTYEQYLSVRQELCKDIYFAFLPDACAIAWHTGLRMSDVANMKRSLVDLKTCVIHSKTMKKSAEREMLEIPMEPDLQPVIHRLMNTPSAYETDMLIPRLSFVYLNERPTIIAQFRAACDAVGLPKHSFHSFRHSFVTRLLNAGIDSLIISSITGQSIEQIQEYAHVSIAAKMAAMARSRGESQVKVIEI